MNYFSRQREDGKWDVLEGTPDEPGRIVTTLDTFEESVSYIEECNVVIDDLYSRITVVEEDSLAEEVTADAEEEPMPWHIETRDGKHCVVKGHKGESGKTVACHESDSKAKAHLRALYHAESGREFTKSDAELIACMEKGPPFDEEPSIADAITAHAEPVAPPAEFFVEPPSEFQRRYVTVTDDGRVMGLLATFDECHVGYGEMCVTPPREADYSHFAVGTVLASDGASIPTGVIAINGGHADLGLDASSARSHYDDAASGLVDVVVGASDLGIWFSGALRPGATPEQIRALRASGVSGDWRLIDGELRLIGICCVNVPGFPKLSVAASADGLTALVAAGGTPEPHPDLCGCKDQTAEILEELDSIHRVIADAGIEDRAIERLHSRITDDDIDALFARIQ